MEGIGPRITRRRAVGAGIIAAAGVAGVTATKTLTYQNPEFMIPPGVENLAVEGIQVVKAGKEGPNIVFLHNSAQVPLGMAEHIDILSKVGQVFAPNLFDLYRSLYIGGNKNPSFADLVNEFSRLGILKVGEKAGFVSSSLGSSFTWEYAGQHLQDVSWVVAGSPTGWPLNRSRTEWIWAFTREFLLPAKKLMPEEVKRKDPGLGMFFKRFRQHPQSVVGLSRITKDIDQKQQMSQITQPVDLLVGETDQYIPRWAVEEMKKLMINSRIITASEYNHTWMIQAKELTDPAVERVRASTGK